MQYAKKIIKKNGRMSFCICWHLNQHAVLAVLSHNPLHRVWKPISHVMMAEKVRTWLCQMEAVKSYRCDLTPFVFLFCVGVSVKLYRTLPHKIKLLL